MVDTYIGQKFNMLTVIRRVDDKEYKNGKLKFYLCKCDCGKYTVVRGQYLLSGHTTSCGCKVAENRKIKVDTKRQFDEDGTRGMALSMWKDLKRKCVDKNSRKYQGYKMDEIWMNFDNFYEWFCKFGITEPCRIERKDNTGIFSPYNCYLARIKGIDARELPKFK